MNSKGINLSLPILGETYIEICDKKFSEFISRQFYAYVIKTNIIQKTRFKSFIVIKNALIIQRFKDILTGNILTYGRHITIKNQKMYINNIIFYIDDRNRLIIESENVKPKEWLLKKVYLNIIHYSKAKKYAAYHLKFYNQILYPIFLLYSFYGYYLVHGSMLKNNDKCVLVTGLDGVGKSSVGNELQKNGWHICADNFVLFNGENAIALNLAMRLEPQQNTEQTVLFQTKWIKEVVDIRYANEDVLSPQIIFILTIGKQYVVKKVECKEVYWSNYMNNAPEIAAANAFIAPIFLHNICTGNAKKHFNIPTYVMEIPKGKIEKAANNISDICSLY